MVFENKKQGLKVRRYTSDKLQVVNIHFEAKRLTELSEIQAVYKNEVKSTISRSKIIKMAVDNLVNDLAGLANEDEAVEYLRELYHKAEF